MLYPQKVMAQLQSHSSQFSQREQTFRADIAMYRQSLIDLTERFPIMESLQQRLADARPPVGAVPINTYDQWIKSGQKGAQLHAFPVAFAHHEEARNWAEKNIVGITTVAVDGSQVLPWRDASIPVALVQAGIFVNPHTPAVPYLKDVRVEVLGPEDLLPAGDDGESFVEREAEEIVHLHRFQLEMSTTVEWMRGHLPAPDTVLPVVLVDGSLLVSFVQGKSSPRRDAYVRSMMQLLETSRETGIPIVGFIDTSYARDMVSMLQSLQQATPLPVTKRLHDALLWETLLQWGDCTVPFQSARGALPEEYREHPIAFSYLRTALDRSPARIEMPQWVAEDAAIFRHVLTTLQSEVIVGNGYPYAIETADAVAVISTEDRLRFYQIFQQFAEQQQISLQFSRKSLSKSRRR